MMQQAETQYAIAVSVRGQKRTEGRVIYVPSTGKLVFHRSRPREHLRTGSFSLDERAAYLLMQEPGIKEIHFVDAADTLYAVDKTTFWKLALPHECGEPGRIHLPLEHWSICPANYELHFEKGEPERTASDWPKERRSPEK